MDITLNNRKIEIEGQSITVTQLLELKKFTFKMLIIKINGQLIKKEDYKSSLIKQSDKIDVIHLISGG